MCGIYVSNIPYEKDHVIEKLKLINFRGPDNLGYQKENDITLGHLRLSILDLDERANQPFSFKHFKIVFNGEIYNFKEIRNELIILGYDFETTCDTEVLLIGYSEWGKEVLSKLNGMFAFAIFDSIKNIVFCARDRMGVKPFYYYWNQGDFEICSQLRPLINSESKVSKDAVSIYLDCGYIPSPFSMIEDVYKLPPGNYMEISLNKREKIISEYWNLKETVISKISYEDAKNELHELLKDAVKIRLQSDVPFGVFLSGGIDSALVLSIASKISKEPINSFTIGFEDPKYDESKTAAEFAKINGSNHFETICRSNDLLKMFEKQIEVYDEPFADASSLPSLLVNSVTKKHATVVLSGDGGDESFFGYWHSLLVNKFQYVKYFPYFIRKLASNIDWYKIFNTRPETIKGILKSKNENQLIEKIFTSFDSLQKNQNLKWLKYYDIFKKLSNHPMQKDADLNIKLWLENDCNVKIDRASMAFSVEVRSPFLDYRVIEFARSLPINYRFQKGVSKKIVRDILAEYIPKSVFNLPKKGFSVPLENWIRNELKTSVLFELNDDFLSNVPNLNVEKFKLQLEMHLKGKYNYSFSIWKLYVLAKWTKEFNIKLN